MPLLMDSLIMPAAHCVIHITILAVMQKHGMSSKSLLRQGCPAYLSVLLTAAKNVQQKFAAFKLLPAPITLPQMEQHFANSS